MVQCDRDMKSVVRTGCPCWDIRQAARCPHKEVKANGSDKNPWTQQKEGSCSSGGWANSSFIHLLRIRLWTLPAPFSCFSSSVKTNLKTFPNPTSSSRLYIPTGSFKKLSTLTVSPSSPFTHSHLASIPTSPQKQFLLR